MHVYVRYLSQTPILIYFSFFPIFFFQNLSCQTRGAAYLRVRLICQCLRYSLLINKFLISTKYQFLF